MQYQLMPEQRLRHPANLVVAPDGIQIRQGHTVDVPLEADSEMQDRVFAVLHGGELRALQRHIDHVLAAFDLQRRQSAPWFQSRAATGATLPTADRLADVALFGCPAWRTWSASLKPRSAVITA